MRTAHSLADIAQLTEQEKYTVYLAESFTTSYPIQECGEVFTDIAILAKTQNLPIIIAPVAPETTPHMYMRKGAAEQLMNVIKTIQTTTDGIYTLKVTDTFRPLALQRKYFTEISADIAQKERLQGQALWERVTQFIADPDKCPPHSTGGAIDCTLVSLTNGEEIDMGTPLDSVDDASNTWSDDITETQKQNRSILFTTMIQNGFVNLTSEWWHYSHGDQYWAIIKGEPHAKYSSQEDVTLS